MAKRRCKKGVVKSGPRKGLCRKVARKSTARKAPKRKAPKRKATTRRGNCEKYGAFTSGPRKGQCRKSPKRAKKDTTYNPYADPYGDGGHPQFPASTPVEAQTAFSFQGLGGYRRRR